MDSHSIIGWIGGGIVTALSILGIGKLTENWQTRRWQRHDQSRDMEITNNGEKIRAQSEISQQMLEDQSNRIKRLEDKIDKLQMDYNTQVKTSSKIEAENQILKEREKQQENEINLLKKENHKQATEIVNLKNELQRTNNDLEHYKRSFDELSIKVSRLENQ